jgi:hypothetical protein
MSRTATGVSDQKREARSRGFALAFSIAAPVIYVICEMRNWPLFTYHPGPIQFDWFYARVMRDLGPAMYWYGWTANALLGGAAVGLLAAVLPEGWTRRIPPALVWILPALATPWLVHALDFYWSK